MVIEAKADWKPANNQLGPTKDTYVSITGYSSEPLSNFGGSEYLYVGNSFYGMCVSAIQFDFSQLPSDLESLHFKSDITVYGQSTRTLNVYILLNVDWNELSVSAFDNPFNSTDIFVHMDSPGNLTQQFITGSSEEITIDLDNYKTSHSIITLIFTTGYKDESWFTMYSKENNYLSSYSDPPRLTFNPPFSGSIFDSEQLLYIVVILLVLFGCFYSNKKNSARKNANINQRNIHYSNYSPSRKISQDTIRINQIAPGSSNQRSNNTINKPKPNFCHLCGAKVVNLYAKFCLKCGKRLQ